MLGIKALFSFNSSEAKGETKPKAKKLLGNDDTVQSYLNSFGYQNVVFFKHQERGHLVDIHTVKGEDVYIFSFDKDDSMPTVLTCKANVEDTQETPNPFVDVEPQTVLKF